MRRSSGAQNRSAGKCERSRLGESDGEDAFDSHGSPKGIDVFRNVGGGVELVAPGIRPPD